MKLALVAGVGPGLGLSLVELFAAAGMQVVASARDRDRLAALIAGSRAPKARAIGCDVAVRADVEHMYEETQRDFGVPDVVVFNAGTFTPSSILDLDPAELERSWKIGCLGGFNVGQLAAREMVARGSGTILFTGATASLRGSARFATLAVQKFGLRALAQSMARERGPKGVHVAHVVIDGMIDPSSEGRLAPAAIAEIYYQLALQPKNAWTFELDLRPSVEKF